MIAAPNSSTAVPSLLDIIRAACMATGVRMDTRVKTGRSHTQVLTRSIACAIAIEAGHKPAAIANLLQHKHVECAAKYLANCLADAISGGDIGAKAAYSTAVAVLQTQGADIRGALPRSDAARLPMPVEILDAACTATGACAHEVYSGSRFTDCQLARAVAVCIGRDVGMSFPECGHMLMTRHTTAVSAHNRMLACIAQDDSRAVSCLEHARRIIAERGAWNGAYDPASLPVGSA